MKKKMKFIYALVLFLAYAELFAQELPAEKKKIKAGISANIYTVLRKEITTFWAPAIRIEYKERHSVNIGYRFVLLHPKISVYSYSTGQYLNVQTEEARPTFAPLLDYQFFPWGKKTRFFNHFGYGFGYRSYQSRNRKAYTSLPNGNLIEVRSWMFDHILNYVFNVRLIGVYPYHRQLYLSVSQGIVHSTFIAYNLVQYRKFKDSGVGVSMLKVGLNYTF